MSWFKWVVIMVLVVLLGSGLYRLTSENSDLKQKTAELEAKFTAIQAENKNLASQIEYYGHPENLVKELKARFNYKEAGEQLFIVIPSATSTEKQP